MSTHVNIRVLLILSLSLTVFAAPRAWGQAATEWTYTGSSASLTWNGAFNGIWPSADPGTSTPVSDYSLTAATGNTITSTGTLALPAGKRVSLSGEMTFDRLESNYNASTTQLFFGSGADITVNTGLIIGNAGSTDGTASATIVDGAELTVYDKFVIANTNIAGGVATFNQEGGTVILKTFTGTSGGSNFFYLSHQGGTGIYNLSGGTLDSALKLVMGATGSGSGEFNISGGRAEINGIEMARGADTTGVLKITGGELYLTGSVTKSTSGTASIEIGDPAGVNTPTIGSLASHTWSVPITTRGDFIINTESGNMTFNQLISGSGDITITRPADGAAVVNICMGITNTSNGVLTVESGKLEIYGSSSTAQSVVTGFDQVDVQDGTLEVRSNGKLYVGAGGVISTAGTPSVIVRENGTIGSTAAHTWEVGITRNGSVTVDAAGGDITFNQPVSGTAGGSHLTTSGTGTITFASTLSTITGNLNISGGETIIGAANSSRLVNGALNISGGGTLTLENGSCIAYNTNPSSITITSGTLQTNLKAGNGWVTLDTASITLQSGTITSNDTAAHATYGNFIFDRKVSVLEDLTGPSQIIAQNILIRNNTGGQFEIAEDGTLIIDSVIASSAQATTNGLIKTGGGTLILTKTNTFTGSLKVDEGTVQLRGSEAKIATAKSVIVADGATLELADGAVLGADFFAGNNFTSAGLLLNSSGHLDLNDGSIQQTAIDGGFQQIDGKLTIEIEHNGGGANALYDSLLVNGDISLGGTLELVLLDPLAWSQGDAGTAFEIFKLADPSAFGIDGGFQSVILSDAMANTNLEWVFSLGMDNGTMVGMLTLAGTGSESGAVPEPGTWAMMLLGTLGLLCFRKKRT